MITAQDSRSGSPSEQPEAAASTRGLFLQLVLMLSQQITCFFLRPTVLGVCEGHHTLLERVAGLLPAPLLLVDDAEVGERLALTAAITKLPLDGQALLVGVDGLLPAPLLSV